MWRNDLCCPVLALLFVAWVAWRLDAMMDVPGRGT